MAEDQPTNGTEDSEKRAPPKTAPQEDTSLTVQVQVWRRTLLLTSVFIGLFLSFLDTTIVSVALATIASEFDDFDHSTWVITAYLLTYMAFAIIITRLSVVFGRRAVEITNFVIFIGFSLGCALSQSMTQLIVFRAFQGIGGSGLFSMTMVIAINAVPPEKRGKLSGVIGLVMVTSGVLGPVLSGAITHSHHGSTWRWIFYINLPVGGIALVLLLLAWPRDKSRKSFTRSAVLSIDFLGCVLLLAASVLLVFALQEGGAYVYSWGSGTIVSCLVVSGVAFLAFVAWQQWLAMHQDWPVKLMFPIRLAGHRVIGSALVIALTSGFIYFIAVVNLPQRFQIVDADSPVIAGVKLLPMMVSSAVGSLTAGSINTRKNMNVASYIVIVASIFQALGCGLMITLGDAHPTPTRQFGFQVFLGLGFGLAVTIVTIMCQLNVEPKWIPVTQGALTQMRSLGGSVGLAVGVIVFNSDIRASEILRSQLSASQMSSLFKSPLVISQLSPKEQALVAEVYAKAFTKEMQVATYLAAVGLVASLFTWRRNPAPPQPTGAVVQKDTEVVNQSETKTQDGV